MTNLSSQSEIVDFDIALKAYSEHFNEPCINHYPNSKKGSTPLEVLPAPSYFQLINWIFDSINKTLPPRSRLKNYTHRQVSWLKMWYSELKTTPLIDYFNELFFRWARNRGIVGLVVPIGSEIGKVQFTWVVAENSSLTPSVTVNMLNALADDDLELVNTYEEATNLLILNILNK